MLVLLGLDLKLGIGTGDVSGHYLVRHFVFPKWSWVLGYGEEVAVCV